MVRAKGRSMERGDGKRDDRFVGLRRAGRRRMTGGSVAFLSLGQLHFSQQKRNCIAFSAERLCRILSQD